jgi:hypothetical protein
MIGDVVTDWEVAAHCEALALQEVGLPKEVTRTLGVVLLESSHREDLDLSEDTVLRGEVVFSEATIHTEEVFLREDAVLRVEALPKVKVILEEAGVPYNKHNKPLMAFWDQKTITPTLQPTHSRHLRIWVTSTAHLLPKFEVTATSRPGVLIHRLRDRIPNPPLLRNTLPTELYRKKR